MDELHHVTINCETKTIAPKCSSLAIILTERKFRPRSLDIW